MLGGAELWCRWLLEFCHVDWQGLGVIGAESDPIVSEGIRVPVYAGRLGVRELLAQCDVALTWGIAPRVLSPMLPERPIKLVHVSHGCGGRVRRLVVYTHLVAVSQAAAVPFGELPHTVIHNGADTRRLTLTRPREQTRAEWGLKPGELAVGYVGRCSPEKRPEAAIQAAEALGPRWRAVLCGPNAEAYPGCIAVPPTDKIGDVLNALDVFVLASPSEGFSLAMIEAMLCGCPIVTTAVGAVPELEAVHGELFVKVPVGASAEQLAAAVRQAVSPGNRGTVERAREVAARNFTARKMGERWEAFLRRL